MSDSGKIPHTHQNCKKTLIVAVGSDAGGFVLVAKFGGKLGRVTFDINLIEHNQKHIWKLPRHKAAGSLVTKFTFHFGVGGRARMTMDEVALFTIKDGSIDEERSFY